MKNLFTQHEIILVTTAAYYQRQLTELSNDHGMKLDKAYWNGHISDLLSHIAKHAACCDSLILRHTRTNTKILKMEFSSNPVTLDKHKSIDSVYFLATMNEN